jgi:hypothetical protein
LGFEAFSQSQFDNGFKEGFDNGYCYNQGNSCIPPIAPIAPIPTYNESSNNYKDGYNRGFEIGYNMQKNAQSYNNYTSNNHIVQPAQYEQPISNDVLIAGAIANENRQQRKLQGIKNLQDDIQNLISQLAKKCGNSYAANAEDLLISRTKSTAKISGDTDSWLDEVHIQYTNLYNDIVYQYNNCK